MWLWRGRLTGAEETGAKAGMRERSGRGRFVPLSFLVFLVGGDDVVLVGEDRERRAAERHDVWHQTPKIRCHVSYWRMPKNGVGPENLHAYEHHF